MDLSWLILSKVSTQSLLQNPLAFQINSNKSNSPILPNVVVKISIIVSFPVLLAYHIKSSHQPQHYFFKNTSESSYFLGFVLILFGLKHIHPLFMDYCNGLLAPDSAFFPIHSIMSFEVGKKGSETKKVSTIFHSEHPRLPISSVTVRPLRQAITLALSVSPPLVPILTSSIFFLFFLRFLYFHVH